MSVQEGEDKGDKTLQATVPKDSSISAHDSSSVEAGSYDTEASKGLTRGLLVKLDTRILPVFILLVLSFFLDRTNVGNAKVYGINEELGLSDRQFQQILFYLLYILAEIPSNLILKKVTPRIWLALITFIRRFSCLVLGLVKNFNQFIAMRTVLSLAKGGLFPGMTILCAIFTYFMLPNNLDTASFLTQEQRDYAINRQSGIGSSGTGGNKHKETFS
ncbi:hypothetical protein B0T18DRAFT_391792 [Schizothecium vesticola]|uniref:Major facilitator superfamily (MFS) profile domain-containing protein n=1 Tax=Schizothecium vesticola TaxID=314040 RepID=A0AA40EP46_9PEZI|nr:hypothetical protein B0T18DRAFT_391792 [Schizothecium vesticola]